MKINFPFLITILLIFSKDCIGTNLDFIPEDVGQTIDEQIITPARNTFLGLIARKIGFVDFFVNLIRGTKHTFFGGLRKERRKPRNGFPQHTTRVYEPILYQDTRTPSPLQISTLNGNGIYMMTAPDLGPQVEILSDQVTEIPFKSTENEIFTVPQNSIRTSPEIITMQSILQKLQSNPIHSSPMLDSDQFPNGNFNRNNGKKLTSNMVTPSKFVSGIPSFSFIQNEMKKVANLPQMFENIERIHSPFHLYQMSNYTIRSQNDHFHILNDRIANFTRVPITDDSISSLEDLVSTPSQLSTSMTRQIHYRRINTARSKLKNDTSEKIKLEAQNKSNLKLNQLQVLTRTGSKDPSSLEAKKAKMKDGSDNSFSNDQRQLRDAIILNDDGSKELRTKTTPSDVMERIDSFDLDGSTTFVDKNDSRKEVLENLIDRSQNITLTQMNREYNTTKENMTINDINVNADELNLTNNMNHIKDDIIHRFQFFYHPKRNAYGFSSDRFKEMKRKSLKSKMSQLKRRKRKNVRKKKKVNGLIDNSINNGYKDFIYQNKHNSDMIHEVHIFSTESPFPSLHLNYKFHDLSSA